MGFLFVLVILAIVVVFVVILLIVLNNSRGPNYGAKCSRDDQCTNGLVCDPTSTTCLAPAGVACTTDAQCTPGNTCAQNVCTVVPAPTPPKLPSLKKDEVTPLPTRPVLMPVRAPTPPRARSPPRPSRAPTPPRARSPVRPARVPTPPRARSPVRPARPLLDQLRSGTQIIPALGSGESSAAESDDDRQPEEIFSSPDTDPESETELVQLPYATRTDGQGKVCRHWGPLQPDISSSPLVPAKYASAPGQSIIDVCNFSDSIFYLVESGYIIKNKKERIQNSVRLDRLVSYNGQLYGLSGGLLHRLTTDTYHTSHWQWEVCPWSPEGIVSACTTLDGVYLCLQTPGMSTAAQNQVHIYNLALRLVKVVAVSPGHIRVYGYDIHTYADIDPVQCRAMVTRGDQPRAEHADVCQAVFNSYGGLFAVRKSEQHKYSGVRLVNWTPFYIGAVAKA